MLKQLQLSQHEEASLLSNTGHHEHLALMSLQFMLSPSEGFCPDIPIPAISLLTA